MNRFLSFSTAMCVLLAVAACGKSREQTIRERIQERVGAFQQKKREECRELLLATAEKIVDSLLLADAQQALNDSLARMRPSRPFQPAPVPPIDSLGVVPIFEGIRAASGTGREQ